MSSVTSDDGLQSSEKAQASLSGLPKAIFNSIMQYLDRKDAKSLRCVNKELEAYSSPFVFYTVLFAQRKVVLEAFQNLSERADLCKAVRTIVLDETSDDSNFSIYLPWVPPNRNPYITSPFVATLRRGLTVMENVRTIVFSSSGTHRLPKDGKEEFHPPRNTRSPVSQAKSNMLVTLVRSTGHLEDGRRRAPFCMEMPLVMPPIESLISETQQKHFSYNLMRLDVEDAMNLFHCLNRLDLPLQIPLEEVVAMIKPKRSGERRIGFTIRELVRTANWLETLSIRLNMPPEGMSYDWERDPQQLGGTTNHEMYCLVNDLNPKPDALLPRFIADNEWTFLKNLDLANIPLYEDDLRNFFTPHATTLTTLSLDHVCLLEGSWWELLDFTLKSPCQLREVALKNCIDYTGLGAGKQARRSWDGEMKRSSSRSGCIKVRYGPESSPSSTYKEEEIVWESEEPELPPGWLEGVD
ncbi:hypothetical protein EV356DRAFT_530777 [Viridothelium virens]|uniref:F-box domain-containing protein n=1 Tax=Viridothelium virens TaxID=1048519 RepID=A0A6A6HGA7_VIRVR|nr:hypothetical protein EV356DRAFT_530777 [Viridothelium virens]